MQNKTSREIVAEMTLEEKASFLSGADFWHTQDIQREGLSRIMMCDGPHGLRKQEGKGDHLGINKSIETVCYPTASALACSFDTTVLEKLGTALGKECRAENVGMLLGPGLNMKRSPLCGRNFEYFSEDPYLAGKLAAAYIKSLQEQGVAACVKHFAVNNQETNRMGISAQVDERTIYEIYLPAFEAAVKEGKTRSVMCAYNAVNGVFCAENEKLLTDILRKQWGFEGFVVTDWGAVKDPVKGVNAGLNLVMPGGTDAVKNAVLTAVKDGELSEEILDKVVLDLVNFVIDSMERQKDAAKIDREVCAALAEELSAECAVLLKNEGILPLNRQCKAAFIGAFAHTPRYQGNGSSFVNVPKVKGALEAAEGYDVSYAQGFEEKEEKANHQLIEEAVQKAIEAEAAVIFAGLPVSYEAEGTDRKTLALPENQNQLIEAVAAVQPNTIVVLHGGAPMELPWITKVKAVLQMYLGGQGTGVAALRLLYGERNPSGKLAETWPLKLQDNPSYLNFPGTEETVEYHEGIFIGYRYYDKKAMEVLFPFGHGLSYTEFSYSDLNVDSQKMEDGKKIRVSCRIKNVGSAVGKEVVQLYVRPMESQVIRPVRELKGFQKVELQPGEEKEVSFVLDNRSFSYYETKIQDWYMESGNYAIEVGASSRDIRQKIEISVKTSRELPYEYTVLSTVGSLLKTEKGRRLWEQIFAGMENSVDDIMEPGTLGEGSTQAVMQMINEMPLGGMVNFGGITEAQLGEMLLSLNR